MVTFGFPAGAWLLALIPVVLGFQRWKSRLRRVELTVLAVVGTPATEVRPPPPIFRLRRRYRMLLTALTIALLTLGVCDPYWVRLEPRAGAWLFVIDNVAAGGQEVGGKRVSDHIRDEVARFVGGLPPSDRVVVLLASPEPRVLRWPEDGPLEALLTQAGRPYGSVSVEQLLEIADDLFGADEVRGRVIASPRGRAWAEALRGREGPAYTLPPDRAPLGGNAGIVRFALGPSGGAQGLYDLSFRVEGTLGGPDALSAVVANNGRTVVTMPVSPGADVRREALTLAPGPVEVRLEPGDAFTLDDRVEAILREPRTIPVAVRGRDEPFLRAAVQAHSGFALAGEGMSPGVDLFAGDPPAELERPTLVVRPTGDFLEYRYRGVLREPPEAVFHPLHPITRHTDFWNFASPAALLFEVPAGHRVLARSGPAPLVTAGQSGGHRLVVWNFDPVEQGLVLEPSFPILVRDSVQWLYGGSVQWARAQGCPDGVSADDLPSPPEGGRDNLLCAEITADAEHLGVPDLAASSRGPPEVEEVRTSLSPALGALALVALAFGFLVQVHTAGVLD